MAKSSDVMQMLRPSGGYVTVGFDYEGITFLECEPVTKAEFEQGVIAYDIWKAAQDTQAAEDKAAILTKLGITEDELRVALS